MNYWFNPFLPRHLMPHFILGNIRVFCLLSEMSDRINYAYLCTKFFSQKWCGSNQVSVKFLALCSSAYSVPLLDMMSNYKYICPSVNLMPDPCQSLNERLKYSFIRCLHIYIVFCQMSCLMMNMLGDAELGCILSLPIYYLCPSACLS